VEQDPPPGKGRPKQGNRRGVDLTIEPRGTRAGVDAEADVDGEEIFGKPKRGAWSRDQAGRTEGVFKREMSRLRTADREARGPGEAGRG